ncbi:Glyoxalase/Bleomycin resistance protein/dioxygenase domain [Collimonas arenae]|uniref:Glyoxalase/Bleomycin resistance protein/dioxygenase domain n=1 Tax=Collimonas arenae TaxID=279058 RepID=A0A0A1FG23_9BURK|nr:VOC family protein [Collimonas arenae]AIY41767.1 Glyoxalase/Bleomycin resistance protein/dioxygenase domain [Collimonas arenae]
MPSNQEKPSKFVWYDVMTSDTKAAETFYRSVVGWNMQDAGMDGPAYTVLSAGAIMVGGLMAIPEEASAMGAKPCWMGYIAVSDVDDYAARVTKAGGSIRRPPTDIPGVGRFAVAADPHGAGFFLFKGNSDAQPAPAAPDAPGHIGWHELHAGDQESAFAFYAGLFGWSKEEAIDMGPMGAYQTFSTGGPAVGGMMTKMPDMPAPCWLYYINVASIDAAVERVNEGGGKIIMGPHQVPGGSWIVQGFDPQGAMFSLVSAKR